MYPSIFLISILNKPLLCIVPTHISHQYSQQIIIMYCTHPYYSSVFSTNHYYVLYPSIFLIFLISILNKSLLCIVPIPYYVLYSYYSVFSTNHYYVLYPSIFLISILNKSLLCIVPIHITHKYSQQTIIMYCTHPYFSSVFSTNHYYVLYPSILLISILNKSLLCIVPIHITHKYSQQTIIMYCTHPTHQYSLLCIVPIHITHKYSQQTIIMYCTHPYLCIVLISILNKPLLCIVPILIFSHQYCTHHITQQTIIMYCTHPYFSSVFSTNHYYVLYPSILLISILNKSLLCIVPIHITHKYSQQTIIMYCTHPYFSSVFSTNHYYVLYPPIFLISILNKPLLCIVPIHITHKYSQQIIIMYCTHPYFSSVFSTNHYYVLYPSILLISILNKSLLCIVPIHITHQYSQQTIIMYCTHPYFSSVFSTNHYYVLYPSILLISILNNYVLYHYYVLYPSIFLISILNKPLLCIVPTHISHISHHYYVLYSILQIHYYVLYPSIFLISILNKSLLCIVPIHITHKYSQQTIIMYCTHPYFSSVFSTNHYYVLYPSILLISILNKPLLCIVPIHISHQYSQQIIIMYCTHPYFSSVFSTNHYYVLYPSILLISILNKSLLCIVPIHITHKYSQQIIIMYCTHPYYS